jgi:hypothetical protein
MPDRTTTEVPRNTAPAERTTSDLETELGRGRRGATPFLLVGSTAVVLGVIVAVLAAVLLLVWWLS